MSYYKTGRRLFHSISLLLRRRASGSPGSTSRYSLSYHPQDGKWVGPLMALVFGGGGYLYLRSRDQRTSLLPQATADEGKEEKGEVKVLVPRTVKRYKDFASVMYEGDMFMTPRDFLESITQDEPRSHGFQVMDDRILSKALKSVPSLSRGSSRTFRDLWNNGVLTYPDYLFLINSLIKPRRQFELIFKMIDVDGSGTIDLEEFERMQKSITRRSENKAIQRSSSVSTSSLIVHMFGRDGRKKLASDDLFMFIDNLQTEVRQMEFQKYSLGGPTITPEEFAMILLRHTSYDLQEVFERLKNDTASSQGISFSQYDDFCQLLNALDDFAVAMTMYNIAGKSLSEEEFGRAARVSIGKSLDEAVIHTVFKIFDVDGDGKLSYKEFLSVMKNWQVRGMKMKQTKHEGMWSEFKTCVKLEMRNQ